MSAVARVPEPEALTDVELTRMRRRHLRRVLAIESQVYPRPWSASLFLSELSQRGSRTYLVARHDGQVVGYAGMMLTGREAHITNIAVDPLLHGRKVGTRLLLSLINEAIARGADLVSLEVRMTNKVAQTMYEKFGFFPGGVRKGYYVETNEDALVMEAAGISSTDYRLRLGSIRAELDALDLKGPRE